jgi:hypothetical protein
MAKQDGHPPAGFSEALCGRRCEPIGDRVELREGRLPDAPRDRGLVGSKRNLLREALRDRGLDVQRYTTCGRV